MLDENEAAAIVLSDGTVLVEVEHAGYEQARELLAQFAELEKSPEHVHTYRITPLSLWNAAASGAHADAIVDGLARISRYALPANVVQDVRDQIGRFGRVRIERNGDGLMVCSDDEHVIAQLARARAVQPFVVARVDGRTLRVDAAQRGNLKMALIRLGFPPVDLAGYEEGQALETHLRTITLGGDAFGLREYQRKAVEAFHLRGGVHGGSGIVVLPCGAGKTMVGIGVMAELQVATLILTPNTTAVQQWLAEIQDKTTLRSSDIGEYTGDRKQIRPVTVTTYQMLTYRPSRLNGSAGEAGEFPHFVLFRQRDWGLIIYDEVHLLPAPVFRVTAEIQAKRRLGLTATLIREDGHETDVFGLIGPKRFDVPWRLLERDGYIAPARCIEIRLDMPDDTQSRYAVAEEREQVRIAAENPAKITTLLELLDRHRSDRVLVIGQYIDQLQKVAECTGAPIITGRTAHRAREALYERFRRGEIRLLIVSKVANFAVDLPDANVAIQLSGTFGSRQEEAQRLGRILRPKSNGGSALFYSLVTRDTRDQDFAAKRQRFLTEQGYQYLISAGLSGVRERR